MPSEVENRGAPILFDVRPLFGILGYLIKWSAYSAGPHTARILLIPDSARYKGSTTVF